MHPLTNSYNATPQARLLFQRSQPHFGFLGSSVLDKPVNWLAQNLYEKGDGYRYLVEQTMGFTAPRAGQQLMRSYSATGKVNKMAAAEMLIRDTAADFTDTILPGVLATLGVGLFADKVAKNTLVSRNIQPDLLDLYHHVAKQSTSKEDFYSRVETLLCESHNNAGALNLQNTVEKIEHKKLSLSRVSLTPKDAAYHLDHAVADLAENLKLSDLELELKAGITNKAGKVNTRQFSSTTSDFLRDLWYLTEDSSFSTGKKEATEFGQELAHKIVKTKKLAPLQFIGVGLALVTSLSVPFLVRLITKKAYGVDAFPGSKVLDDSYHEKTHTTHTAIFHKAHPEIPWPKDDGKDEKEQRFKPFPYIQDSLKKGKIMPLLASLGFFGVLGAAVFRNRVWKPILSKGENFNFRKFINQYAFDRQFPWTPMAQMELTYGMLCGMRLLTARDNNEFSETMLRDCALGWPTLTYGFPLLKKLFSGGFTKVWKGFHNPSKGIHLLTKGGDMRSKKEISAALFRNLKKVGDAKNAVTATQKAQRAITVGTGLTSLALLAGIEPQLGIWMTNNRVVKQHRKAAQKAKQNEFKTLFTSSYTPLQHNKNSLFNVLEVARTQYPQ